MGTRSMIGIKNADQTVTAIYCHWDGYPSYNGDILVNHYTTESKIRKLMNLGDISSLGYNIGRKHGFNEHSEKFCTAYGRDRGEKVCEAKTYANMDSVTTIHGGIEYVYIWDGKWSCWDVYGEKFVDLYSMEVDVAA